MSIWRMICPRLAPIEIRMPTSLSRLAARASRRPATFAQQTSSTRMTVPIRMAAKPNAGPRTCGGMRVSCSARTAMRRPCRVTSIQASGYAAPSWQRTDAIRHPRARLLDRDTGLESRVHERAAVAARREVVGHAEIRAQRRRDPYVGDEGADRAGKPDRRDTDDGELARVHTNRLSDDCRIARESALPESVRDDGDGLTALHALLGSEGAAEHHLSAKHLEVVVGDDFRRDALEVVVGADGRGSRREPRDAGEDVRALRAEVVQVGER